MLYNFNNQLIAASRRGDVGGFTLNAFRTVPDDIIELGFDNDCNVRFNDMVVQGGKVTLGVEVGSGVGDRDGEGFTQFDVSDFKSFNLPTIDGWIDVTRHQANPDASNAYFSYTPDGLHFIYLTINSASRVIKHLLLSTPFSLNGAVQQAFNGNITGLPYIDNHVAFNIFETSTSDIKGYLANKDSITTFDYDSTLFEPTTSTTSGPLTNPVTVALPFTDVKTLRLNSDGTKMYLTRTTEGFRHIIYEYLLSSEYNFTSPMLLNSKDFDSDLLGIATIAIIDNDLFTSQSFLAPGRYGKLSKYTANFSYSVIYPFSEDQRSPWLGAGSGYDFEFDHDIDFARNTSLKADGTLTTMQNVLALNGRETSALVQYQLTRGVEAVSIKSGLPPMYLMDEFSDKVGFSFNSDGSRLLLISSGYYFLGYTCAPYSYKCYRYDTGTSPATIQGTASRGIAISGNYLYIANYQTTNTLWQYNWTGDPLAITTVQEITGGNIAIGLQNIKFSKDGTRCLMINSSNKQISTWTMSTPHDMRTATYRGKLDIALGTYIFDANYIGEELYVLYYNSTGTDYRIARYDD